MHSDSDTAALERARQQLQAALSATTGEAARRALADSLRVLDTALDASPTSSDMLTSRDAGDSFSGSIDYTFDDEAYQPHGRQVEVRVFYRWEDYNRNDPPLSAWGASIEQVEVLAVRYFDEDGHEVSPREHHDDLAWDLLEAQREQVTELCTEDGYHRSVGVAAPSYTPPSGRTGAAVAGDFAIRLAPSQSTRTSQEGERRWG
ncbi:MAG: hypothetical protein RIC55_25610 [Pirellulaceae bacterium]